VARPFDRTAPVSPAGVLDSDSGQFWVNHPWEIVTENHNLSAFERNRVYLNLGGGRFVDISFLSGADSDGDGRAVVPIDVDEDGMQDLLVRQAGGGPLVVYRNRFPKQHWLRVSLHGCSSNRQGIGARLTAHVGDRQIVRELFPSNTFASQRPAETYFGLADANRIDRLVIRWPSGTIQELTNVAVDRHLVIVENQR
jgi:hypothetical protein